MGPLAISLAVALVAAVADARTGQIPNWLTLPAMALALVWHGLAAGSTGVVLSALGLLGSGFLPYLVFRMGGMGGGDVKLFAALGAFNGLALGSEILMLSLVIGCLQAFVLLAWRRQLGTVLRRAGALVKNLFLPPARRDSVPATSMTSLRLGPAIFASTVMVLLVL